MSDVKIQQKQALSRQEAARFIAALAEGLGQDGKVTVRLGSSTLELSVADRLDCELEVAVDGDEMELELELKWSTAGRASADAAVDASDDSEQESEEDDSEEGAGKDASAGDEAEEAESDADATATGEAGKPAFDGVDSAAVRAWAAANGLTVSPRGRIKEEVLQAYRDAGN